MVEYRRRRVPRQAAGWEGRCLVDDDPAAGWLTCRVLDISVVGVGVEVLDPVPADLMGRRLAVDVRSPATEAITIHIVAEVRNVGPGANGGVRVGMEFAELSETERSVLDALEMLQVAW